MAGLRSVQSRSARPNHHCPPGGQPPSAVPGQAQCDRHTHSSHHKPQNFGSRYLLKPATTVCETLQSTDWGRTIKRGGRFVSSGCALGANRYPEIGSTSFLLEKSVYDLLWVAFNYQSLLLGAAFTSSPLLLWFIWYHLVLSRRFPVGG
jgi:hypothetical protein